jgi:hypothetical protein
LLVKPPGRSELIPIASSDLRARPRTKPQHLARSFFMRDEAMQRAEDLRPVFAELAGLSTRRIAEVLNERKIPTPAGGAWHSVTVIRVQKRLG